MALSRGSPRVGVTHHRALWSPDFPRRACAETHPCRDHPADSSATSLRRYSSSAPAAVKFVVMASQLFRSFRPFAIGACALALAAVSVLTGSNAAIADQDDLKRKKKACTAEPRDYACLKASTRREVAGDPVMFRGTLSKEARRNLASWTDGENTICLIRYAPRPNKDGSWPWETLDQACTTLNTDGTFGIEAFLGKQGLHYYGVEMGPCRADEDECGGADQGLIGAGGNKNNRVVAVRTVAP